jgi:hypothetical protein
VSGTVTGFANGTGRTIAQTLTGAGVVRYTVTATLTGCPSAPVDILQTVNSAPAITTQPVNRAVCQGGSVTFTAVATGVPTPTVQWQLSTNGGGTFVDIPGATTTSLTVSNVTASMNGYQYRVVFTNTCGTTPTNAATLTVNQCAISFADPQICTGPGNVVTGIFSVTNNGPASVSVLAVVALPAAMPAIAGSCTNCTINNSTNVSLNTTLTPGQTLTATFLAQIGDQGGLARC